MVDQKEEIRNTGATAGHRHPYGMGDKKTRMDDTKHQHALPSFGVVTGKTNGHEHTFRPFK